MCVGLGRLPVTGRNSVLALLLILAGNLIPRPLQAQTPPPDEKQQKKAPSKSGKKSADQGTKAEKKSDEPNENAPEGKPLPQISPEARYDYQGEATFILQNMSRFHSAYEGENSLRSRNEMELSHTYTLFLGARLVKNVEVYINPEIAWGNGVGEGEGLSAGVNADLLGQPELRPYPYLARYFVRWRIPMKNLGPHNGKEDVVAVQTGRAPNIIAGKIPAHRIVLSAGKMAVNDLFDVNSYADNPREQFLNDAFNGNLAYDYAQETRGYNLGITANWVNPNWSARIGTFAMSTVPGGADLAYDLNKAHSEQIEFEIHPQLLRSPKPATIFRFLAFRNVGSMGSYRDALSTQPLGMPPDLTTVRKGGAKYGFGLNFEQALADGGDTGVFGRFGWNDGGTESQTFESDRFASLGIQISGAHWHRKKDRVGFALAQSDLTGAHKAYLAAGGIGDLVGDGALRYGSERVLETYYSYHYSKHLTLTLDYQYVTNPGYNRDRGPISFVGFRAHVPF
ncbi:MAG: porin [Chthonomonadaceae bacterium]|nr:porin [Chthonomonadaceae bacterium]